ncbi:MAG: hypothetical protein ACLFP6_06295 [Spirochaetaceae bacterium]
MQSGCSCSTARLGSDVRLLNSGVAKTEPFPPGNPTRHAARLLSAGPNVGNTLFVAIDGHGGSGKSTLASALSKDLEATVIHIDEFSGPVSPPDRQVQIVERLFEPIAAGAQRLTHTPAGCGKNHHPEAVTREVTPVMILESVSAAPA